jgi:hypothetical protein
MLIAGSLRNNKIVTVGDPCQWICEKECLDRKPRIEQMPDGPAPRPDRF